jgi:hypothetical protein
MLDLSNNAVVVGVGVGGADSPLQIRSSMALG